MAYRIVYKKSVTRDLNRLPKTQAARILGRIERDLSKKADTQPALKGPFAGLRRFRVGDYRVIYAIIGEEVLVLRIAHRGEVYRKDL